MLFPLVIVALCLSSVSSQYYNSQEEEASCDSVECPQGEKCVLKRDLCFAAPCPPLPMCVPMDEVRNKVEKENKDRNRGSLRIKLGTQTVSPCKDGECLPDENCKIVQRCADCPQVLKCAGRRQQEKRN